PFEENPRHASRQLGSHFPQRHHLPRTSRAFDLKGIAQVMMELLKRFDEQKVHGEPDRPSPIGIAAEESGRGFARLVVHSILHAVGAENIWLLMVDPRNRPDAVRREEFPLIEHHSQYLAQLFAVDDREQSPISLAWRMHASDVVRQ